MRNGVRNGSRGRQDADGGDRGAVDTTFRVRFAETDAMGIVYYANYLVWFEVGRGAFCNERGIDYRAMMSEGLALPVLEATCRYVSPARYNDEVTVRTWAPLARKSLLTFRYVITRGESVLATGETRHMLIDADGRPKTFPDDIAARFLASSG